MCIHWLVIIMFIYMLLLCYTHRSISVHYCIVTDFISPCMYILVFYFVWACQLISIGYVLAYCLRPRLLFYINLLFCSIGTVLIPVHIYFCTNMFMCILPSVLPIALYQFIVLLAYIRPYVVSLLFSVNLCIALCVYLY